MKGYFNVSPQMVSWVKSDKARLEANKGIERLFYPASLHELKAILDDLHKKGEPYDIIGYSSNTLFLPSYRVRNLICTIGVKDIVETEDAVICDCGVPLGPISLQMAQRGFLGFEGLSKLPGTVAAGVIGNACCSGCSLLDLVQSVLVMDHDGNEVELLADDLRGKIDGLDNMTETILQVTLVKRSSGGKTIQAHADCPAGEGADLVHQADVLVQQPDVLVQQPDGVNTLGITFMAGRPTSKGRRVERWQKRVAKICRCSQREANLKVLKLVGGKRYVPYLWSWDWYLFPCPEAHALFDGYQHFLSTLYEDLRLKIEIRK